VSFCGLHDKQILWNGRSGFCSGLHFGLRVRMRSTRSKHDQIVALVALVGALFLLACHKPAASSPDLTLRFEAPPEPVRVGPVNVSFILADAGGKPVAGAHLAAEADMTHAGMSPVFGTVEEKRPGRYESTLNLAMAGDWVILLHGTFPDGAKLERQFELKDVRPN
jgi:hypothetical protein